MTSQQARTTDTHTVLAQGGKTAILVVVVAVAIVALVAVIFLTNPDARLDGSPQTQGEIR